MLTLIRPAKRAGALFNASSTAHFKNAAVQNELIGTISDYRQNVNQVTLYCTKVRGLPSAVTLKNKADWYTPDFINKYAACKAHVNSWIENFGILDMLYNVPKQIISYDTTYQRSKDLIISSAQYLRTADPESPETKTRRDRLLAELNQLLTEIKFHSGKVKEVNEKVNEFAVEFNKYKTFFADLYTNSKSTKDANKTRIDDLTRLRKELQDEIDYWNNVKLAALIATGVSGIIVLAAFWFGPIGLVVSFVATLGVVAGAMTVVASEIKIKRAMETLAEYMEESDSRTLDADVLKTLVDESKALSDILEQTKTAISDISSSWTVLENSCTDIIESITKADREAAVAMYMELVESMRGTEADWAKLVEHAGKLSLVDIQVDNTKYDKRLA